MTIFRKQLFFPKYEFFVFTKFLSVHHHFNCNNSKIKKISKSCLHAGSPLKTPQKSARNWKISYIFQYLSFSTLQGLIETYRTTWNKFSNHTLWGGSTSIPRILTLFHVFLHLYTLPCFQIKHLHKTDSIQHCIQSSNGFLR